MKELTSKEKLFCTYYSISRNEREAASKSGYLFPEKAGVKLIKKEEIISYIKKLDRQRSTIKTDIAQGYIRLAFGCVSDSIKLLFSDEVTNKEIEKMDLFNVAEIKKKKGGDIEIKFFDRLKALEKLSLLENEHETLQGASFYSAIAASADKLKEADLE